MQYCIFTALLLYFLEWDADVKSPLYDMLCVFITTNVLIFVWEGNPFEYHLTIRACVQYFQTVIVTAYVAALHVYIRWHCAWTLQSDKEQVQLQLSIIWCSKYFGHWSPAVCHVLHILEPACPSFFAQLFRKITFSKYVTVKNITTKVECCAIIIWQHMIRCMWYEIETSANTVTWWKIFVMCSKQIHTDN